MRIQLVGTNIANYTVVPVNGTLTITHAPVTVTVVPSTLTPNASTNVTYTTTVASTTSGMPTGTVTLTAASGQVFGPFTLNASGVATGTGKLLGAPVGADIVSASYSGDANFTPNAGTTTLNVGIAGYTLTASPSSITVTRGQSGSSTITLTPAFGYTGTATFSCNGLPAFASCNFAPATLIADGSGTAVSTVMTLYTLAPNAKSGSTAAAFWIPGAMLALLLCMGRRRMTKRMQHLLMLALLAAGAFGTSGCGSRASFVTPTGTSQFTVVVSATATAGTGSSNLQLPLNITITINP